MVTLLLRVAVEHKWLSLLLDSRLSLLPLIPELIHELLKKGWFIFFHFLDLLEHLLINDIEIEPEEHLIDWLG